MTSDEERREVAKRLRSKKPAEFGEPLARSVFRHVFRSLYPKQIYPVSSWALRMPYVLADLIDRPTCRNLGLEEGTNGEGYDFFCSRCGFAADVVDPRYCPCCGAEVIE